MIRKKLIAIIMIFVALQIAVLFTTMYFGNQVLESEKTEIITKYENRKRLLVENIENRINNAVGIVELTSNLPLVKNVKDIEFISEELKGIPQDKDIEKRKIAQKILQSYPDFEFITFNIPNGDFYLMEPYVDQLNLTRLNFADRDWYRGVMETKKTYVSDVYESTTLKRNVVAIRAPVFDDTGTMIGIWGGSLDLQLLTDTVSNLALEKNARIIIFDQYGKTILSIGHNENSDSAISVDDIKNAISGQADYVLSDELQSIISFDAIRVGSSDWSIVLIRPYNDAFFTVQVTEALLVTMNMIIGLILGLTGYFIYKMAKRDEYRITELQQVSQNKDEFSAMISHELKTPLVPIIGYAKMLLKENMIGTLNKDQHEAITVIQRNAQRLERLINDILDARKLDIDKMKFDMKEIQVDDFINNMMNSYKPILQEQGIKLELKSESSGAKIKSDDGRLRQVFENLITNAVKFVPSIDGNIRIGYKTVGQYVQFFVSDNGIGIPKDKQGKLFQKFYQIDTSERRKNEGTGLGLVICKGIIERMNGQIWVESDGSHGSVFYFTVPRLT